MLLAPDSARASRPWARRVAAAAASLSAAALLGLVCHGCLSDSSDGVPDASLGPISSATAAAEDGPDAIGGQAPMQTDEGDLVLSNPHLRAVIDRPGEDPGLPGAPLQNLLAPSGGTLIDLVSADGDDDQWNQMTQGVVGVRTVLVGDSGAVDAADDLLVDSAPEADQEFATTVFAPASMGTTDPDSRAFIDPNLTPGSNDFITNGVQAGDVLTLDPGGTPASFEIASVGSRTAVTLAEDAAQPIPPAADGPFPYQVTRNRVQPGDVVTFDSGPNQGRQLRVAAAGFLVPGGNAATLALFRAAGVPLDDDASGAAEYTIQRRTSPIENIADYDDAQLLPGDPATLRLTGAILNQGAVPDGCAVAPMTSHLTVGAPGGPEIELQTDYELFRDTRYLSVESRITNPGATPVDLLANADVVVLGGFQPPNIAPWTPLAGFEPQGLDTSQIVPFVGFRGRGEPGVSYAVADTRAGQLVHASNGETVAAQVQLPSSDPLSGGDSITWLRQLAVGRENDVSSAADTVIQLLSLSPVRVNPSDGTTIPNMYEDPEPIRGRVVGAPPGTRVTALQVSPGLTFDPGPPNGLTAAPGFHPSTVLGAPELLVNTTVPAADGAFSLEVPARFAGRPPGAAAMPDLLIPPQFEPGSATAYRVLVEAPGHDPQNAVVNLPGAVNNLVFDLTGETGTLELVVTDAAGDPLPATVLVEGVDPDGPGPARRTPDPRFGALSDTSGDVRATGDGTNRLSLVDGAGTVTLAPGSYRVLASRGLEYSLGRFPPPGAAVDFFTIAGGETVRTETSAGDPIALQRLLDSDALPEPGGGTFTSPLRRYVGADLRVHSGGSFDDPTPFADTLAELLAAGVEVAVNTEHDNIRDLAPALQQLDDETATLDLASLIRTQVGVEATPLLPAPQAGLPNTAGSFSGWPVPPQPELRRNGAPADELRDPAILIGQLRGQGAELVQINTPRAPIAAAPLPPIGPGYFTNGKTQTMTTMAPFYPQPRRGPSALVTGGYDTPLRSSNFDGSLDHLNRVFPPGAMTRRNDFDLIELYAGVSDLYEISRLDYYALASAGYVRTATASSNLGGDPGFPRTYVFAADDASADLPSLDLEELNDTLRPRYVQATPGTTVPGDGEFFPAEERSGAGPNDMDVLCSSGPVVFVEVDADQDGTFDGEPGDLVSDDGDDVVDVRVTVLAAPWVPVDQVAIFSNGGSVLGAPAGAGALTGLEGATTPQAIADPSGDAFSTDLADVVRLRQTFNGVPAGLGTPPPGDAWIVVEVQGTVDDDSRFSQLAPGVGDTTVGFTNPVFIDKNGDGVYDPNGVP